MPDLFPMLTLLQETVDKAPESAPWLSILLAMALIVAVGVGSFKSSKRGHQD